MSKSGVVLAIALLLSFFSEDSISANLYDPASPPSWVSDARARKVGDAVTILILETSSAETQADSTEDNNYNLQASISDSRNSITGGLEFDQGGSGRGRTTRAGRVRAQITARVNQRLENGDLMVGGSQLITVNGEQQLIAIEGVVRPVDLTADNTVLSSRLMNSRINFNGEGWVTDTQRPGWLRRLLRFIGL